MKPSKSIELIAFDKNHHVQYKGKCKLRINRLSSMLSVEPENEEFKMISVTFKCNFIIKKNILFVLGEHECNDFTLAFDQEIRCKKVYDFICKDKVKFDIGKDIFYQRFWIPFCYKLSQNDDQNVKLKQIVKQLIDNHESKEKEEIFTLLKEKNVFDRIFSLNNDEEEALDKDLLKSRANQFDKICNERARNLRKRKHGEITADSNTAYDSRKNAKKKNISKKFSFIIEQTQYKFVNVKPKVQVLRRLLVFTSPEKNYCYEFAWGRKSKIYHCIGCEAKAKEIFAITGKNKNSDECIKMEDKKHICVAIEYIPEKYTEIKIFKKPDYEILQNCNTYLGVVLIIFDKNDRSQCWDFRLNTHGNLYMCRQCNARAKIWNQNTEEEYIELRDINHQCNYIQYEPKKYYEFGDFILSPNFEIQKITKNGQEKKILIIFDKNDRSLCHVYSFNENIFFCRGCIRKSAYASAKVCKNSDGEEYVILLKSKHVCKLRPYANLHKKEIILYQPDFEVLAVTKNGTKKVFIFDSNDRSLCYIFSQRYKNRYVCRGCLDFQTLQKKRNISVKVASLVLCNEENGETFIRLNGTKHLCQPKKYEPEKYAKKEIQKCHDYLFFRQKQFQNSISIALFHPENKTLCFKLSYNKSTFKFQCDRCLRHKLSVTTKIEKDPDGKEYFNHDYKKHICDPIKISSLRSPNHVILKRNDLNFEKPEKKAPEIDESRIIKPQNFAFRPNRKGDPDANLFIFSSENRNLGFKYYLDSQKEHFVCYNGPNCNSSAKLQINENGEKVIILGPADHKCKPVKYEKFLREEKTVNLPEFITIFRENKVTNIILFTSPAREECYEFSLKSGRKSFKCLGCNSLNKSFVAKLCQDENGQDILQLPNLKHFCVPRKYIKEKYEPKIYKSDQFQLLESYNHGRTNKRLIVFTTDKKDFVYEYGWSKKNSYICLGCHMKNLSTFVKVIDDDESGQKYVECAATKHDCEPRKYDPSKYVYSEPEIICSDQFVFHDGKNGEKDKYLIVFTSDTKEFAYKYFIDKPNFYRCGGCNRKNQYSSAKIIEAENGIKSVKLSQKDHVCEPQKYDPKKY